MSAPPPVVNITNGNPRKGNPYLPIIAPLLGAYAYNKKPNPHEVWLAATYLTLRTKYWGGTIPTGTELVDGNTGGGGGSTRKCCKTKTCDCKGVAGSGARADGSGAKSPVTNITEKLLLELKEMSMNQPNAWQDWCEVVAYFYNNCAATLMYFTYRYKNGAYSDLYNSAIGLYNHPKGYTKGIQFSIIQEGILASDLVTYILTGTTHVGEVSGPAPYFAIYGNLTTRNIYWINTSGYAQPSLTPLEGITDNYFSINGTGIDFSTNRNIILNLINTTTGTSGLTATINFDSDNLEIVPTIVISALPESTFNIGIEFNPIIQNWSGTFTNFIEGQNTIHTLAFNSADISLADRFFVLYDDLAASYMFYYNLDGAGTFVPPFVPDNLIPVNIFTGNTEKQIAKLTQQEINITGIAAVTLPVTEVDLVVTYIPEGPRTDFDPGTAIMGINYTYNDELIASDGTVLTTGISDPEEYATNWNNLRVPYELTLGYRFPYLDPRIDWLGNLRTNIPCGACNSIGGRCWTGTEAGCTECLGCNQKPTGSTFRTSPFNMYNLSDYNTPGNIFLVNDAPPVLEYPIDLI